MYKDHIHSSIKIRYKECIKITYKHIFKGVCRGTKKKSQVSTLLNLPIKHTRTNEHGYAKTALGLFVVKKKTEPNLTKPN